MLFKQKNTSLKVGKFVLRGTLHKPVLKKTDDSRVPLLVMFHGFTGNKTEHKFAFVRFSRLLEQHGIASLRFDFSGSGESDGDFEDINLTQELKEAERIYRYAEKLDFVSEVWLMGFSMGGLIASILANRDAFLAKKMLLWSPLAYFEDIMEDIKKENKKRLQNQENLDISGLPLSLKFLKDIENKHAFLEKCVFQGKVKIIHGKEDLAIPFKRAKEYQQYYGKKASLKIIENADHCYNQLVAKENLFKESLAFLVNQSR